MEKWNKRSDEDKLITRISICVVALLTIFFLFSCNKSHNHVEPVTSNDTPYTTTDSITVIDNNTGLEESVPGEVVEPVNDTTNLIK
tara:strand:+ start:1127 stop:1384 length:258 start_codon:yes stop_codon:yes gene_type:complete